MFVALAAVEGRWCIVCVMCYAAPLHLLHYKVGARRFLQTKGVRTHQFGELYMRSALWLLGLVVVSGGGGRLRPALLNLPSVYNATRPTASSADLDRLWQIA